MNRRDFLKTIGLSSAGLVFPGCALGQSAYKSSANKPNLLFVFADQYRKQAMGFIAALTIPN